jgi:prepilin-type N-terminal cleavage/methylation domain-containing protein
MRLKSAGFTLIELLLAMAIAAVLFGITSILLSGLIPKANLNSVAEILTAELRSQQLKTMSGGNDANDSASEYGVHIESGQYTFFEGNTYDINSPSNFVVVLPSTVSLQGQPSQTIVFSRLSGEVMGYTTAQTITITDTLTGNSRVLNINKYGIPE